MVVQPSVRSRCNHEETPVASALQYRASVKKTKLTLKRQTLQQIDPKRLREVRGQGADPATTSTDITIITSRLVCGSALTCCDG